ncbi:MAG: cardiolipin synthase [Proteobacteria bacterium]|nr:cardiolipin synthase [Pseudomonadota bacterium]
MTLLNYPAVLLELLHLLIVFGIVIRVIMKRPATGVALAWLMLVAAIPYGGALIYLMIGERRVGDERTRRIDRARADYKPLRKLVLAEGIADINWSRHAPAIESLGRLGRNLVGMPTVRGNFCEIISDTQKILNGIRRDIDQAQKSLLMEFYIWNEGGAADEVLDAVIRASKRGVRCRLLIDALGARPWWKSEQPDKLRAAGVQLEAALPVSLFRTFVGRTDLRMHRKIIVVDANVAWTGSMNLVDPRYFKQDSGVGEWVDAMVRLKGTVIIPLAAVLIGDWAVETGESVKDLIPENGLQLVEPEGEADIQVIPSGPAIEDEGLLQMFLGLINSAQKELVLTTPYLVPDDSLLKALRGAAGRGVEVSIIVPEKVDSFLTRYASRSYFDHLLEAGIHIFQYQAGLLHTKSVVVDGHVSMFGTVNLDMRSLWLNYELSLFVYDVQFANDLRQLQQSYIEDSLALNPELWANRPASTRLLENILRLMSPLL